MKNLKNIKPVYYILTLSLILNAAFLITAAIKIYENKNIYNKYENYGYNGYRHGQAMRLYKDELNLNDLQLSKFREIRSNYMTEARMIRDEMNILRAEIYDETISNESDNKKIAEKSKQLGNLHSELKILTADYFKQLMSICDTNQQKKLKEIFLSMQNTDTEVKCRMNRNFINN